MNFLVPGLIRIAGRYLFFGNIFIAACAFCLCWATCILLGQPLPVQLALFVFFATWLLYNFDSLLPSKRQQQVKFSRRRAWVQVHQSELVYALILAAGIAVYLFFQTLYNKHCLLLLGHLAILSLLYSVPVVPVRGKYWPLRHIPLLKSFLIAYVWTCVTVWLPLLANQQAIFTSLVWVLFAQRFLFLLAITIVFDIRDIERDKATGTVTLPGTIGVQWAKYLAWLSLLLFALLVVFIPEKDDALALALSGGITAWVVASAGPDRSEYFYAVAGDGMMLLQLLLLLVFKV